MDESMIIATIKAMSKGAQMLTDDEVKTYLDAARQAILNRLYPFSPAGEYLELPPRYDFLAIRVSVYFINKRGAEGQTKHIEVGTERDYAGADIPEDILKEIVPMCGVPM